MLLSLGSVEPSDFLSIGLLVLLEGLPSADNAKVPAAALVHARRVQWHAPAKAEPQTSGLMNDEDA